MTEAARHKFRRTVKKTGADRGVVVGNGPGEFVTVQRDSVKKPDRWLASFWRLVR